MSGALGFEPRASWSKAKRAAGYTTLHCVLGILANPLPSVQWGRRPVLPRGERITNAPVFWLAYDGMVRPLGTAPSSPAWKAEILLLNDGRMKWPLRQLSELRHPVLQTGVLPSELRSAKKMARATSAALALCSARQADVHAVELHTQWPARVTRPVL